MSLRISRTAMTSDQTSHAAALQDNGTWMVSWLIGRDLSQSEAVTAMTLAEVVASHDLPDGDTMWPHVNGWAAELGMTGKAAVAAAAPPDDGKRGDAR